MAGAGGKGESRGLLKPKLAWGPAPAAGKAPVKPAPSVARPRGGGQPSNAVPLAQYNLDQLKKMAESRGLPVEKLVAQMIQQYLKEGQGD